MEPGVSGILHSGLGGTYPRRAQRRGAVALYMDDAQLPDIQWRMRLKALGTLEHYLQELAALTTLQQLPEGPARLSNW